MNKKNNRRYRGDNKRQSQRQSRQPSASPTIAQIPVDSFTYEKRGSIGVVLAKMKNGYTGEIKIADLSHGINAFMKELKFYTGYTPDQLKEVKQAIRAHEEELKLTSQQFWNAVQNNGGRLQVDGKNFLVVEETMEANAALAKILAKAASFTTAQTPSKNGSKVSSDQRQTPNA